MKFNQLRVSSCFSRCAGYRPALEAMPPMIVRQTYAFNCSRSPGHPLLGWLDRRINNVRYEIYEIDY
jgi:hypothetical protein